MVFHMLAVFDRETARAPTGLESWKSSERPKNVVPNAEEIQHQEELCRATLERTYTASRPTNRKLTLLGHGTGFTFEATPYCSYAARDHVHVLFAGEVGRWPGIDAVSANHDAYIRNEPPPEQDDAHWLLDFYASFIDSVPSEVTQTALESLAKLQGSFAFIIYDEVQKRVFAARDAQGSQPLYWGATDEGQLMFASNLEDLEGCDPTAISFPPGALFASERHTVAYSPGEKGWVIADDDWPGQLMSFVKSGEHFKGVKTIPRVTSKGILCGAIYKVESEIDMNKLEQPAR